MLAKDSNDDTFLAVAITATVSNQYPHNPYSPHTLMKCEILFAYKHFRRPHLRSVIATKQRSKADDPCAVYVYTIRYETRWLAVGLLA